MKKFWREMTEPILIKVWIIILLAITFFSLVALFLKANSYEKNELPKTIHTPNSVKTNFTA